MKLDATLKRLGVTLQRRLNADLTDDCPPRIEELMQRLHRAGENANSNRARDKGRSRRDGNSAPSAR